VRGLRRRDRRGAPAAGDRRREAVRRASRRRGALRPLTQLPVRLQPRAGRDEIVGERGGRLLVRVTAPPVGGKANDALCRLIAKRAGLAPSKVTILRGHTARDKVLNVEGIAPQELRAALGLV
jgi:uncharacterized protein (TIGR00251 family)